jgi:hypothetical protein
MQLLCQPKAFKLLSQRAWNESALELPHCSVSHPENLFLDSKLFIWLGLLNEMLGHYIILLLLDKAPERRKIVSEGATITIQ